MDVGISAVRAARTRSRPPQKSLIQMVDALAICCSLDALNSFDQLDWAEAMLQQAKDIKEQHRYVYSILTSAQTLTVT